MKKIRSENDNDFLTPTFDDLVKKYKNLDFCGKRSAQTILVI